MNFWNTVCYAFQASLNLVNRNVRTQKVLLFSNRNGTLYIGDSDLEVLWGRDEETHYYYLAIEALSVNAWAKTQPELLRKVFQQILIMCEEYSTDADWYNEAQLKSFRESLLVFLGALKTEQLYDDIHTENDSWSYSSCYA